MKSNLIISSPSEYIFLFLIVFIIQKNYAINNNGRIILADDAGIINNATGIYIAPYANTNISDFRKNYFSTTAILHADFEVLNAHKEMNRDKGVQIRENNFNNTTTTSMYPNAKRGISIKSDLGTYTCNDNPNNFDGSAGTGAPNVFSTLTYGIYSTEATTSGTNIIIQGNTFTNNIRGAYVGGTTVLKCNLNNFTLNTSGMYGLYLNDSTAYQVMENTFTDQATFTFSNFGE